MPPNVVDRSVQFVETVAKAHEAHGPETTFEQVLAIERPSDDDALADLIEADGRYRLERGRPVELTRYLSAISGLPEKPVALDAAIDMSLRSGSSAGSPDRQAAEALAKAHPEMEAAIWEAFELGQFVGPSSTFSSGDEAAAALDVSRSFGPELEDGERRYAIIQQLGRGAFGTVYLAVDGLLSEADHPAMVAIKLLHDSRKGGSDSLRFLDEAARARRIRHENVISVLDAGVSEDRRGYIIYEYVDGGDLLRWLRRHGEQATSASLARLVAKVARGVHAAHVATVIHNDIKPSNILMTTEGEPKIADFGVAGRLADTIEHDLDSYGAGNLAFMAPERVSGAADTQSTASDVYSLGCLLYFLLTRRLPSGDSSREIRSRLKEIGEGDRQERTPPSTIRQDADADLDAICERAMSIDPADRLSSAAELADDLERWVAHRPISWRRPSTRRRLRLWMKRQPALAGLGATAMLLLIVGAAAIIYSVIASARAEAADARAEAQAARAEIAEMQAQQKEQIIEVSLRDLDRFLDVLGSANDDDLSEQVLTPLWMIEWVIGPRMLASGTRWAKLWDLREETIQAFLENARRESEGRTSTLEVLVWETSLAFWKVKRGAGEEALPLLERNIEGWGRLLPADDPWMDDVRTIRLAAEANALIDSPRQDEAAMNDARRLAEKLEAATVEREHEPGSPVRLLALDVLESLYGPEALDDENALRRVETELAKVREFSVVE